MRDNLYKDIAMMLGDNLVRGLLERLSSGEKIVSLLDIETKQIDEYTVKYSQKISVEDLVRCKDCKYRGRETHFCFFTRDIMPNLFYCALGTKKEES